MAHPIGSDAMSHQKSDFSRWVNPADGKFFGVSAWPAPGSDETRLSVLMEPEVEAPQFVCNPGDWFHVQTGHGSWWIARASTNLAVRTNATFLRS